MDKLVKDMTEEIKGIASKVNEDDDVVLEPAEEIEKEKPVAEKPKEEEPKSEVDDVEVDDDNEEVDDDEINDEPEMSVSDEMVEKAIKAGISYKDVLKINDEELIGRMIGIVAGREGEASEATPETEEQAPDLSFLDIEDIYDVEDPKALFQGIKETLLGLTEQISTLKSQRQKDVLIDSTSEMMSKLKPDEQEKVKDKMEILSTGYRQRGVNVSASELFEQASQLALGETLSRDAINKLKKRSTKSIQRVPGRKGNKVKRPLNDEEIQEQTIAKMEKMIDSFS